MKHTLHIALSLILLLAAASCGRAVSENEEPETIAYTNDVAERPRPSGANIKSGPRYHDRVKVNNIGHLREVFNDSNATQLIAAKALGITPISDLSSAYFTSRPLVHIYSNQDYTVDSLKHSVPFLVPEAAALLTDIGRGFIDTLALRGADGYRIIVTSLLRTPTTVKKLRRVNVNATEESTHQFATTFDLSYVRFDCLDSTRTINEGDLKNVLAEVLYALHQKDRCYVKFERKTGCFHVTVRPTAEAKK